MSPRSRGRTAAGRRTHHRPYRLAVPTPTAERLAAAVPLVPRTTAATAGQPRLLYVCSGQGSQYAGMARGLLAVEPLFFRSVIRRCDEEMDWSIEAVLGGDDPRDLADTSVAQPVTVAVQVALAELLRGYGVMPAAVVGHSVGEISAAVISGALPLGAGIGWRPAEVSRWPLLAVPAPCWPSKFPLKRPKS
ncbi:acyltransferase domain-containing protein [Fodinicola feengrottensis]|uniref:acyltransferase domain-containing protein n=1 Tax=Fodinicola feengrottensis TaxID=435914 RepID=UPI0013D62C7D